MRSFVSFPSSMLNTEAVNVGMTSEGHSAVTSVDSLYELSAVKSVSLSCTVSKIKSNQTGFY